jgi:enamine deaminase RidA (YjgF/YER057c/UK114 family)
VTRIPLAQGQTEWFVTAWPEPGEHTAEVCRRLAAWTRREQAHVLLALAFGSTAEMRPGLEALQHLTHGQTWPMSWLDGAGCAGHPLAGIQLHAVSGARPRVVSVQGRAVGAVYQSGSTRFCSLGGVGPADIASDREHQTQTTFEAVAAALAQADMGMTHLARTWLFLDRILEWYPAFNRVRTQFYTEHKVFDGLVPASTGIGASNHLGAALIASAFAFSCPDGRSSAVDVPSPMQCSACSYGSSFSRAVELTTPWYRRLMVSGTASIEPGGKTVHEGDVRRQTELTLQIVQAILGSRGLDWGHVARAVAYIRSAADAPLVATCLATPELCGMPVVLTRCDVCRDDLLFEIELDAVAGA